jgi:CRP-like cAMP-binding protein
VLILERLATWLTSRPNRFAGTPALAHALLLLAEAAGTVHHVRDHVRVRRYPTGSYVVEQGEAAAELFLIMSGEAEVWRGSTSLTCLVLSPAAPTKFAGRGEGARLADGVPVARANPPAGNLRAGQDMVSCDVSEQVMGKVEALSAYRSQLPLEPDMFPEFLQEMFGREHFVAASTGRAAHPDEAPLVSVREPERSAPPTAR